GQRVQASVDRELGREVEHARGALEDPRLRYEVPPHQTRARVGVAERTGPLGAMLASYDVELAEHGDRVALRQIAAHARSADRTPMAEPPRARAADRGRPVARHQPASQQPGAAHGFADAGHAPTSARPRACLIADLRPALAARRALRGSAARAPGD